MTGIAKVVAGAIVKLDDDREYVVRRFETPTRVAIRDMDTNEVKVVPLEHLRCKVPASRRHSADLDAIAEPRLDAAQEKYAALKPLLDVGKWTPADIDTVAARAGVARSTVYRWLKDFQQGNLVSNLMRKTRKDVGVQRLPSEVEKITREVITDYWLTPERRSATRAHREVKRLCWNASPRLTPPSLPTFMARIAQMDSKHVAKRRIGQPAADKLKLVDGTVPFADRPYGILQIDHTLMDIQLVDEEHRIPIGRPWLTLAIDVYSRMVAGYYISFDPPGTLGTGICVANAILSKKSLLSRLGLTNEYPCMGKPQIIHMDNAREFHGKALERACLEYGIDLVFRKIKTPRYGAHIERHLGTLGREIHALPGTTFSNSGERGSYDSEGRAALTLKELELWLGNLIIGLYHNRVHGGTDEEPIRRYTRGILGDAKSAGVGQVEVVTDEERLRIDFLPLFEPTVQTYGIKIDHICYHADVLRRWVGSVDPKRKAERRKFICRRDPRDISSILFYDPDAETYFRVPYRDMTHPAISLWELRAIRAHLRDQGKKDADEELIFRALDEMRRIEEEAVRTTAKARRSESARRSMRRRDSPQPPAGTIGAVEGDLEDVSDDIESPLPGAIVPYDEVERF
ncbi:DDE-type integrase/transposase/recombinase [Variovorax sp. ZS18.2.2]|uniref:Mu transposase C-terminal domain-containing protein n=1 Tax=Variovorax sp. ZS18.2.2 TaxID=2971255 RepID=UPI002151BE36|nr:DDE-type integrase/transposase/recombinase [Variovorax sp. ZS18.2.2]MCR6480420.1 DDE-type integrase/transposase/recombinase [Variovorax sp. ZS18.2.2]